MRRILALACAAVMLLGVGMTVSAAPSVTSSEVTTVTTTTQTLQYQEVAAMTAATEVQSDVEATFNNVGMETVGSAIDYAKDELGNNVLLVTIFDLHVPAGTGAASFTVANPNIFAGQSVKVLHQKADGQWETIIPTAVANGSVTFTLTSYSPVAIVVDGTASKTADVASVAAVLALVGLAGTTVCAKKRK